MLNNILRKRYFPLVGHIDLTYSCNLKCIHCYCQGSEDKDRELSTREWKKILATIQKEGCLWLTLSGGEPLMRPDFLELYAYAKKKGFMIIIFTNGLRFNEEIIKYLVLYPPYSIEITLNGITEHTYETITQTQGSYRGLMRNLNNLKKLGLPLMLKTNLLKQNMGEIVKIKAFIEEFLGLDSSGRAYFKCDPMIYPRFNADKAPVYYRLSPLELTEIRKLYPDVWKYVQIKAHNRHLGTARHDSYLYSCGARNNRFFINPYGRLKFCMFLDKFNTDLKTGSFRHGFYKVFPKLLEERFKSQSKCRNCKLKLFCHNCPARAYYETGNEEAAVDYYCQLARIRQKNAI